MTLRALLDIQAEAFETTRQELVTDAAGGENALRTQKQTIAFCRTAPLGEDKTLVREEFDLPARLEVGDVLSATGEASVSELTGGAGRIGICGTVEVRVLHKAQEAGDPLVMTSHELPFELSIDAQPPEGARLHAQAEAVDVMADSIADDKHRTLRVEAEVRVRLSCCVQEEKQLLEDLYSITGDELIPQTETFDIHQFEESADARESTRLQVALPKDAPPIGSVLTAFAQPTITAVEPAGKRLNAEGVMAVTLIYLPMDSDIPMAVRSREPFEMTFPMEAADDALTQAHVIEATPGPGNERPRGGALRRFAAHGQTRRAADGGDCRCGAAPGGETRSAALCWFGPQKAKRAGRRPNGCASPKKNCIRRGKAPCWRFADESDPRTRKRPFCLARKRGGKHRKDKYPHRDETNGYMTVTDKKMRRQKKCHQQQTKKNVKKYH